MGDPAETGGAEDIRNMSFEAALKELEDIVRRLEGGDTSLDEAIEVYERGAKLKQHCEAKLKDAKARVERISVSADGTVETAPFEEN